MFIMGLYQGLRANTAISADGVVLVAAEKERLSRKKHDSGNIDICAAACCSFLGINQHEIDAVGFVGASEADYPYGYEQVVINNTLVIKDSYKQYLFPQETSRHWQFNLSGRIIPGHIVDHHVAHASAAYFTSPFESALLLSYDGWGDFHRNCMIGIGIGNDIIPLAFIDLPIGLAFKKISKDLFALRGHKFDVPGKLMALASLGEQRDVKAMQIFLKQINSRTNFYDYSVAGFGPLKFMMYEDLDDKEALDFAATLQKASEALVLELVETWRKKTATTNLCVSGGSAQNIHINSRLVEQGNFANIYVVPFSHDGGLGIGVSQYVSHCILGNKNRELLNMPFLGPTQDSPKRTEEELSLASGIRWQIPLNLSAKIANSLANGGIVALFQGRSEVGPRALGNRSLLIDPRQVSARANINKIKKRETFRPFAASIPEEYFREYFVWGSPSPFMTYAIPVRPERQKEIPAVVHADGTCRVQTVSSLQNKLLYDVLIDFELLTGTPVLLNTSLNTAGEPIVENINDALQFLLKTNIDILIIDKYFIERDN